MPAGRVGRLSRRTVLRLAGGLGATAVLTACGGGAATEMSTRPVSSSAMTTPASSAGATTPASGASPVASPSGTMTGSASVLQIVDSGAQLPTGDVTFRWLDNGGAKANFFKAYVQAYHQAHPNITIDYQALPTPDMSQTVALGVQNGNAPDVLQLPSNVTASQAVQQGWLAPLDDAIPDFARWKAALPPNTLQEGTNVFDGKTYSFPVNGTAKEYFTLTYFNVAYLQRAGYDPATTPLTWEDLRTAAKKVTTAGKGQYYGYLIGGKQAGAWENNVRNFAAMAGASNRNDMDWRTGRYIYTSDQYLAVIDLLLALKADGSVFPGSLSLATQDAASRMPTGVAGIFFDGPWNIGIWRDQNPEFQFNVGDQPVPNTGTPQPLTYGPNGGTFWLYATSKYKAIAGDIFAYLGSESGMLAFQRLSGAPRSSIYPAVDQATMIDERSRRMFKLYDRQMRLGPESAVRNADVSLVYQEQRALKPSFGEVVQGIYSGQLKDAKAAMQDLQDRSEAELDRAIKAAQAKGAKVARDDWKFANWDPAKDYTQADYTALS